MNRREEFDAKLARVRDRLEQSGAAAAWLRGRSNTAWLGAGPADGDPLDHVQGSRGEIWSQSDTGVMSLLVTPVSVALLTENIELPRLMRDEFGGLPLEVVGQPWHESDPATAVRDFVPASATVITDLAEQPLQTAFERVGLGLRDDRDGLTRLRAALLPREIERYRWLGRRAAEVMTDLCHLVAPGIAEADLVAEAHLRLRRLGIAQEVDIVCSDGRMLVDRHGLYGDHRIERATMIVFCAHKWGLVANLTRMVHLGPAPSELVARHRALAAFDARLMAATRPGRGLGTIFREVLIPGYADLGHPEAWRDHHQGGSTGYAGRDQRVTPTTEGRVVLNQAFAWNPSLPGIKSEDSFVVGDEAAEVLTIDPRWPVYDDSGRPAILELG